VSISGTGCATDCAMGGDQAQDAVMDTQGCFDYKNRGIFPEEIILAHPQTCQV